MAFAVKDTKAAIVAKLSARAGLAGVLIRRGLPVAVPAQPERIYISTTDGVSRTAQPSHGIGDEVFIIHVMVEVVGVSGADHQAVEDRMWDVAAEVDAQVTADPEFGVALCASWLTLVGEHTAPAPGDRYVARGLFQLHCRQRF